MRLAPWGAFGQADDRQNHGSFRPRHAVRQERVVGNGAHTDPALPLVQALGVGARGVEHEQRPPEVQRDLLRRLQEHPADPSTPAATVHDHLGELGPVRLLGLPVKFSRTAGDATRPAPALGEHTEQVLAAAGFTTEQVASLIESGAAAGPNARAERARFMA